MTSTFPTALSSEVNSNIQGVSATKNPPLDITKELAALKHEKHNHNLHRLPPNVTIQRRPLNHPPIASPFAGDEVSKIVYVSANTPLMAAVKRVRKLLGFIEKRATQSTHAISKHGSGHGRNGKTFLESGRDTTKTAHDVANDVNDQIASAAEEVLVKASGRAMKQALKVGEWFKTRERDMFCHVKVRTGSVSVVDDIVEVDEEDIVSVEAEEGQSEMVQDQTEGDTTLELLGQPPREKPATEGEASTTAGAEGEELLHNRQAGQTEKSSNPQDQKSKRKKRKRPVYDKDDLPEARLRWIKTVEVAISLRH